MPIKSGLQKVKYKSVISTKIYLHPSQKISIFNDPFKNSNAVSHKLSQNRVYPFLHGGGDMGKLVIENDWSKTPIGPIGQWSQSLRTTLGVMFHSGIPMFLFWGDDLLCFYNDAFRPSLGKEGKHPAIGKKGKEVWNEIWDYIGPMIEKVMTEAEHFYLEDQLVPFFRDGRLQDIYWTFSYSPAYDDDGSIAGTLVTCIETTKTVEARLHIEEEISRRTLELEIAQQTLLSSNNYLQHIINIFNTPLQVLEPVFDKDEIIDFRFKLTNAAYAMYANSTPADIQGKKVSEIFPNYFQTTSFTNVVKTFKTGITDTWEVHYDQDGLDLYNEMTATKMGDDVVLHFTDFTKLKHLQLELLGNIKELERSNQNLEEFTHAVSHDLKEPIRKILLFSEMLRKQIGDSLPADADNTFKRIDNAALRMETLIEDLLQFSHVSERPPETEMVDMNYKLKVILEDLEIEIEQKKAIVNVGSLPKVKGYERQLQQMFQNLLSNALKYSRKDIIPEINISSTAHAEHGERYHLFKVKDNGIGFEQKYADKIFQMFSRLHGRKEYNGTGIGLSIVKKVVENHGGMIKVTSIPGEGSCFNIYLPEEQYS